MMRQQDALTPFMGLGNTCSLRTFYEIGYILTHTDPICRHVRWEQEYPFLVPDMARFGLEDLFTKQDAEQAKTFSLPLAALHSYTSPLLAEKDRIHPRLRCALFHKENCDCEDSIAFGAVYVQYPLFFFFFFLL